MLTYTVELIPQKEGGYTVTAPALPGCISEGDTAEQALKNIREAAEGYITTLIITVICKNHLTLLLFKHNKLVNFIYA